MTTQPNACRHVDDEGCLVAQLSASEPRVARARRSAPRILEDLRPGG